MCALILSIVGESNQLVYVGFDVCKSYLYQLIGFTHNVQDECTLNIRHLFQLIFSMFCAKNTHDRDCLKPISIKKLKKDNTWWSTTDTELDWTIDTDKKFLTVLVGRK